MKRAVAFYCKAFNMTVVHESPHWTSLESDGVIVGLHWNGGSKVPLTPRDSHGAFCGGTLTFNSDDVKSDRRNLESLGCKILGEMDEPWGHMLIFEDLDGNVLKLQKAKY